EIDGGIALLLVEPAAHPRREHLFHIRGHGQIITAGERAHVDFDLRLAQGRREHRRQSQHDYSFLHRYTPWLKKVLRLDKAGRLGFITYLFSKGKLTSSRSSRLRPPIY